jgi:hypothetical protein
LLNDFVGIHAIRDAFAPRQGHAVQEIERDVQQAEQD